MGKPGTLVRTAGLVAALAFCDLTTAADPQAPQLEFFESRIRPVLVERCYACHNSADTSEGGLAIDWREGIEDAEIIIPGNPGESRLLAILRHEVEGLEMPEDGPKLSDQQIADFEKWIASGAPDPRDQPPSAQELAKTTSWEATLQRRKQWWSFQPIADVEPPETEGEWSDHPLDRFIEAKQTENQLSPNAQAEDAVLIRRLYFNLIGLPPTQGEVQQWTARLTADRNAGYTELVDHLLRSPRFGERWARHWMDWIRYAESHGSEGDPQIDNAWLYRDYLIRALNADVPYDQLVREHVAGDLLDEPRINIELGINESMIGPAHWRMVFHGFAPTDALDEKVRFVDDQVSAFSKAFLGLTVSCARCHDHKFDAISQSDYYALFGILASCRPGRNVIDSPARQTRNVAALKRLKPRIREAIARDWLGEIPLMRERLIAAGGPSQKAAKPDQFLHPLHVVHKEAASGKDIAKVWQRRRDALQNDQAAQRSFAGSNAVRRWEFSSESDFTSWYAAGTGIAETSLVAGEFALRADGDQVLTGVYPAGVYSHALSAKHSARFTSPDVDLDTENELWVQAIGDAEAMTRYVVQDYPRNGTVFPVNNLKPTWSWQRFDLSYWTGDQIHVELTTGKDAPLLVKNQDRSWFGIRNAAIVPKGSPAPGDDREFLQPLYADPSDQPSTIDGVADRYAKVIQDAVISWRDGNVTDAQARMLDRCVVEGLLPNDIVQLPNAAPLVRQYRQLESEIPVPTRVPGLAETRGRKQPLYVRGNHKSPGEITPRRFLEAIDATPYAGEQSGRRRLAEDLLRDDNPLTPRVIVNRIWHHLFGHGIVRTPDNFGRLGQLPTHPELLDYLAGKFRDDGWSLKRMIRLIVTSKTWRQSTSATRSVRDADPDNQYLARANLRRLEAEAIRDSMLKVSTRLDQTAFGRPLGGDSNRRSVYVQVIRNRLDPFLRAFDFPEPFSSTGRRDVTNVPAQSLMLMNDPAVASYANAWAKNILRDGSQSDQQRIQSMFVTAFGRQAATDEIEQAKAYMMEAKKHHERRMSEITKLQQHLSRYRSQLQSIKEPARKRLLEQINKRSGDAPTGPEPIARWEFADDFDDASGSLEGLANGDARIENGSLVVNSGGHVVTAPLGKSLKAKTLEAWVRLDNLDQHGGGVMTVQTSNGVVFDSIVFAERDPHQWMAGSNGFSRTQSFNAPQETEASKRAVHVVIVYQADGMIIGYRNGKPYGDPYKSNGPMEFKAGEAIVSFGVRHLPPIGNRMLSGRISKARLYDRALSAAEIEASANALPYIDDLQLLTELDESQRTQVTMLEQEIERANQTLETLGPIPPSMDRLALWADLARAMFTFKEFIYIR